MGVVVKESCLTLIRTGTWLAAKREKIHWAYQVLLGKVITESFMSSVTICSGLKGCRFAGKGF